ncbi:Chitin synthase, class 3 [Blyttiomyces sp. JEL0837]|nr:Chitin synthase, class 3 [Blyttiomyces sp. JEL0837]
MDPSSRRPKSSSREGGNANKGERRRPKKDSPTGRDPELSLLEEPSAPFMVTQSGGNQKGFLSVESAAGSSSNAPMHRKKSLTRRSTDRRRTPDGTSPEGGNDSTSLKFSSLRRKKKAQEPETVKTNPWVYVSWVLTCCIPTIMISKMGKTNPLVQQAFREKVALCIVIFLVMLIVGFLTFGFQAFACHKPPNDEYKSLRGAGANNFVGIHGVKWGFSSVVPHPAIKNYGDINGILQQASGADLSALFPPSGGACSKLATAPKFPCVAYGANGAILWPPVNVTLAANSTVGCHLNGTVDFGTYLTYQSVFTVSWDDVTNKTNGYMVYNGLVLDIKRFYASNNPYAFGTTALELIIENLGKDATLAFANRGLSNVGNCIADHFKIATVDLSTPGCVIAGIVVQLSFAVILALILARFVLALYFSYVIGWRMGNSAVHSRAMEDLKRRREEFGKSGESRPSYLRSPSSSLPRGARGVVGNAEGMEGGSMGTETESSDGSAVEIPMGGIRGVGAKSQQQQQQQQQLPRRGLSESDNNVASWNASFGFMDAEVGGRSQGGVGSLPGGPAPSPLDDPTLMHCLAMVPCYSEGEASLKATLNSIAHSYYPSTHKTLFVVADGIVKGKENPQSTPDLLIDMMEVDERFRKEDPRWGGEPPAYSYVAIADGVNRKNYARVYAGWYKYDIEAGPEVDDKRKQRRERKANAGDRDGQGQDDGESNGGLMRTIRQRAQGRVPILLVVKVGNEEEKDSAKPGNRGKRDSQIILMNFLTKVMFDDRMTELEFDIFFKLFTITGVNPEKYECCLMVDADTRIYPDSLTHMVACLLRDHRVMGLCGETKISNKWDSWVFEYFISHHLSKAFESVFGGVTCLPGCFSMYRIKTPKGPNGYWVPILANPDVVEEYSENIVDTLHKKNLLLLGEDRFLTTMMLRAFPKRHMVFVPQAICKTVVPDTFQILLSQRRRWINSTIHNLMELLLVKDLCGTFCISMQFVIFMELVGTVVLPAAISFTLVLIVLAAAKVGDEFLPLILLAIILLSPAVLIVITAKRVVYVFWMLVYLLALPIWNFVLPLYAFWHFDDFSWGATRKVAGEVKGHDHSSREGEFDGSGIHMKRWTEWVKVRKAEHELAEAERMNRSSTVSSNVSTAYSRQSVMGNVQRQATQASARTNMSGVTAAPVGVRGSVGLTRTGSNSTVMSGMPLGMGLPPSGLPPSGTPQNAYGRYSVMSSPGQPMPSAGVPSMPPGFTPPPQGVGVAGFVPPPSIFQGAYAPASPSAMGMMYSTTPTPSPPRGSMLKDDEQRR